MTTHPPRTRAARLLVPLLCLPLAVAGCAGSPETPADPAPNPSAAASPGSGGDTGRERGAGRGKQDGPGHRGDRPGSQPSGPTSAPGATGLPADPLVVVISVDGLASYELTDLGRERLPHLWDLIGDGASTLNARTEVEMTVTMPNHVGMMTGRRIDAAEGGHGWTVNFDNGDEVGEPDRPVASIFDVVAGAGEAAVLFSSKSKFAVFDRSWPSIEEYVYVADNARLAERAIETLTVRRPELTFLHLSAPDDAGHTGGWGTAGYDEAVELVDSIVGRLRAAVANSPGLERRVVLVLTADHGGQGREHGSADDPKNFTIPFVVAGPGVPAGTDLYALNPGRLNPLNRQTSYNGPQPVRNGDAANLVAGLLGLDPVPGSQLGVDVPLVVTAS